MGNRLALLIVIAVVVSVASGCTSRPLSSYIMHSSPQDDPRGDWDGDGHVNAEDAFPENGSEWVDSDGDGAGDNVDTFPRDPGVRRDTDNDGIGDSREGELGTDPVKADTDGDGFKDGKELDSETDPLKPDTDGDGVKDGEEVERGLNPIARDTDSDGMDDGKEIDAGLDPKDSDVDGDGRLDGGDYKPKNPERWQEYPDASSGSYELGDKVSYLGVEGKITLGNIVDGEVIERNNNNNLMISNDKNEVLLVYIQENMSQYGHVEMLEYPQRGYVRLKINGTDTGYKFEYFEGDTLEVYLRILKDAREMGITPGEFNACVWEGINCS